MFLIRKQWNVTKVLETPSSKKLKPKIEDDAPEDSSIELTVITLLKYLHDLC